MASNSAGCSDRCGNRLSRGVDNHRRQSRQTVARSDKNPPWWQIRTCTSPGHIGAEQGRREPQLLTAPSKLSNIPCAPCRLWPDRKTRLWPPLRKLSFLKVKTLRSTRLQPCVHAVPTGQPHRRKSLPSPAGDKRCCSLPSSLPLEDSQEEREKSCQALHHPLLP